MSQPRVAVVTGGAGFTPPLQDQVHYFVYVLRSLYNGSLYIGCTSDLATRFETHQKQLVASTKSKGPWELLYYEAYRRRENAYKREQNLKQFGGAYRQLKVRLQDELKAREVQEAAYVGREVA